MFRLPVIKRLTQVAALILLVVTMMGADSSTTRLDRIGHKLVCQCGCGQILMECNHVGCPVSPKMIAELRTQVDGGVGEKAALAFFIDKYGPIALAAPIRGGFDNVAWIAPFAVFALAVIAVLVLVRFWKRRHPQPQTAAAGLPVNTADGSLEDRIRRDTDYDRWSDKS